MAKIKKEEAAWLAGLFDGEGCVSHGSQRGFLRLRLRVGMTHFDTIMRMSDLLDQADVKSNYYEQPLPSGKIIFTCEVAAREDALRFVELLLPYSITKASDLRAAEFALRVVIDSGEHDSALIYLAQAIPPRYNKKKG